MKPTILFRPNEDNQEELEICKKYFDVKTLRTRCRLHPADDRIVLPVIGRYSVLPFYKELEDDLGPDAYLINSYKQHKWIADFEWYFDANIQKVTPKTYFEHEFYQAPEGEYIVKGKTNSRKFQWNTKMFADNKRKALAIGCELSNDGLIGPQGLIYREYIPLKTFEVGINNLPFSNEWRFFFYKDQLVDYGYYWSIAENIDHVIDVEGIEFAENLAKVVMQYADFFTLDIAQTEYGDWILIEINDGQMAGLSCIDPDSFYSKLRKLC